MMTHEYDLRSDFLDSDYVARWYKSYKFYRCFFFWDYSSKIHMYYFINVLKEFSLVTNNNSFARFSQFTLVGPNSVTFIDSYLLRFKRLSRLSMEMCSMGGSNTHIYMNSRTHQYPLILKTQNKNNSTKIKNRSQKSTVFWHSIYRVCISTIEGLLDPDCKTQKHKLIHLITFQITFQCVLLTNRLSFWRCRCKFIAIYPDIRYVQYVMPVRYEYSMMYIVFGTHNNRSGHKREIRVYMSAEHGRMFLCFEFNIYPINCTNCISIEDETQRRLLSQLISALG